MTTARTKRCTFAIRTRTASNWPGTARKTSGRATRRDTSPSAASRLDIEGLFREGAEADQGSTRLAPENSEA